MFNRTLYESCDVIQELSKDKLTLFTKYVLYKKDGTEVVIGGKSRKISDIDVEIEALQEEKMGVEEVKTESK